MFSALHQPDGTARECATVICCWLVFLLLMQGLAAGATLVRGPAHMHGEAIFSSLGVDHQHAHADGLRHTHAQHELAVITSDELAALDAGALQLLSILTALGVTHLWLAEAVREPLPALRQPIRRSHLTAPPRRPPRG